MLTAWGGDAELAGALGLAEAEGEQLGGAQPPSLEPFTFVVGRGAAGKGWHGLILPVGWSSSNSSPQPDRWPLYGGRPAPGRSYAGQPQGQHSDEGSGR